MTDMKPILFNPEIVRQGEAVVCHRESLGVGH